MCVVNKRSKKRILTYRKKDAYAHKLFQRIKGIYSLLLIVDFICKNVEIDLQMGFVVTGLQHLELILIKNNTSLIVYKSHIEIFYFA